MNRQIISMLLTLTLIGLLSACGASRNSIEPVTQPEATQEVVVETPTPTTGPEEAPTVATQESEPQATRIEGDTLPSAQEPAGTVLIAFDTGRDGEENTEIYVMDTQGENLRNLTNHPAGDASPAWSPDGATIAWISNREGNYDIYTMTADGTNVRRLTDDPEADVWPAWSPDGASIAFMSKRDGDWEIYVMDADGANPRRLTTEAGDDRAPAWSPDGIHLLFSSDRAGNDDIYMMTVDGSQVIQLTDDPAGDIQPAWSPDGRQILFASERSGDWEIYLMQADGSGVQRLTNNSAPDFEPSWSPDGETIVWHAGWNNMNEEIFAMNADGSDLRRLTNHPANDTSARVRPIAATAVAFGGEPVDGDLAAILRTDAPKPRLSVAVTRVSVASDGAEANAHSRFPAVSADGRYVAFESEAGNLVADDTNGVSDIFVHDRETGETERVSVASGGAEANGASHAPAISADGRYVVFESQAINLTGENTNGRNNVFVHDRQTGDTSLVSVGLAGMPDQGGSYTPAISADGRYVAFASEADHGPRRDIYLHDRETGQTGRISEPLAGLPVDNGIFNTSTDPVISADGRYVAFVSGAASLVNNDTNERSDTFVYDRDTGEMTRVSVASDGTEANDDAWNPAISADGRYVAFETVANNLVSDDPNYDSDVFVHDRQTGQTVRVSAELDQVPEESDRGFLYPTLSGNGRYVAFNGLPLYIYDLQTGQTLQTPGGSLSAEALDFSADGQYLVYESGSAGLIDNDTNGSRDIFVQDVSQGLQPLEIELAGQQSEERTGAAQAPAVSGDTVELERTLADGLPELPGGFPRLPIPENIELEQFEGRLNISYLTATPVEEARNLYRTALSAQGWTPESERYLDFVQEEFELGVDVGSHETSDKTRVRVSLRFTTPATDEALSTIPVLPDAEFMGELAGEMGESHSYLTATDIDLEQLAETYRQFYQTRLYDQGWSLTRDSTRDFERGQSRIDISLGETRADRFTNYITMDLFYTQTESGYRFAHRERGCSSYLIEEANDLNSTPPPADFDVNGYVTGKVNEYATLLSTAADNGAFELLCAGQGMEAGRADYEFWLGGEDRFYLRVMDDDARLRLILMRVDRATNTPTEYLEYEDFDTGQVIRVTNQDYTIATESEETQVQEKVFFPLIEHIEALTGLSILSK